MPWHASQTTFHPPTGAARRPGAGRAAWRGGAGRAARLLAVAALAFLSGACAAASRPADPARPRVAGAPYPVVLGASEERREQALATFAALTSSTEAAAGPTPELRPVTATLSALPPGLTSTLRLPLVGGAGGKQPTEEEVLESLRRFVEGARPLLGADPVHLSLVEHADAGAGARRAVYQQKPFDYPLRGGYGVVEVTHAPDRRVLVLSSTALPDTERLGRALDEAARQQLPSPLVPPSLANRGVTFKDPSGNAQTYIVAATDRVRPGELVVYPLPSQGDPSSLELHLAWEMTVERPGSPLLVYVDALKGDVLAAAPAPPAKS